jgi:putative peptidoglycan lipid II flippase
VPLLKRIPRLVLSAAVMGVALYFAEHWFAARLASGSPLVVKAVTLLSLVAGGAILYFLVAFGTGGADFGMIRRNARRKDTPAIREPSPDQ